MYAERNMKSSKTQRNKIPVFLRDKATTASFSTCKKKKPRNCGLKLSFFLVILD